MSLQHPVFIPGPTNIPERLRKACDIPTMDHRSAAFADVLNPALEGVKRVLKTETGSVVVFPGSGTGGWEAAITNTLNAGDKVVAGCNGTFSTRWIDLCQRHGLNVDIIDVPWGDGLPALGDQALAQLSDARQYRCESIRPLGSDRWERYVAV